MSASDLALRGGQIVLADWRGDALPREPNKRRPAVVVEDERLFVPVPERAPGAADHRSAGDDSGVVRGAGADAGKRLCRCMLGGVASGDNDLEASRSSDPVVDLARTADRDPAPDRQRDRYRLITTSYPVWR